MTSDRTQAAAAWMSASNRLSYGTAFGSIFKWVWILLQIGLQII
jgi:hypothetical protein